jgi:hypothetical protein
MLLETGAAILRAGLKKILTDTKLIAMFNDKAKIHPVGRPEIGWGKKMNAVLRFLPADSGAELALGHAHGDVLADFDLIG